MLVSSQTFEVGSLGVSRRFWGVYGRGLFIHVVRQRGVGIDEDLVPTLGYGRRAEGCVTIGLELEGTSVTRMNGTSRETTAGTVMLLPGRGVYRGHLEPSDDVSWSLIVEFDGRVHPCATVTPEDARLASTAAAKVAVASLCEGVERAVAAGDARACAPDVEALFAFLRAEGLPVPTVDLGAEPCVPPSLARLQRAVDGALSQTDGRPMLVDVENESGLSSRTLQRAMPALCALWGQRAESFRDHARRILFGRACALMVSPRATTQAVARVLGFASANAFCRAMMRYGLPSPGAVRARFRALG
jgi:hypothetical protein